MEFLKQHVEAIIFASPQSVPVSEIKSVLDESFEAEFSEEAILDLITQSRQQYSQPAYAFELVEIAGGWQFLTKGAYHNSVSTHLKQTTKKRLSRSALETLSIIAYKQPVSKTEMENIRGVNCDYALQKLLEKELVSIVGRSDGPGRPLLYGTSEKFMDYFGLKSLKDLPVPKEFKMPDNEIGEQAPIEENIDDNEEE